MAAKKEAQKKNPIAKSNMPVGFVPLTQQRVLGWFVRRAGNQLQGTIQDSFTVKSQNKRFPDKKVYKIEITGGQTDIVDPDGGEATVSEGLIGIDETGYLKKLGDLAKGREVFIDCKGKESDDQQAPWIFEIGVVPF